MTLESATMEKGQGPALTPDGLRERLAWRYATKKYDPARRIEPETWAALEESLRMSPSSYGLQPWKFWVVQDPATRAQLRAVSYNQSPVTDASHYVVLAHRTEMAKADVDRLVAHTATARGLERSALAGFDAMLNGFVGRAAAGFDVKAWAARQVYIALGTFLTSAAVLGVDATPMEGFDAERYDALLKLPEQGYHAQVAIAAGYRAPDDAYAAHPKVRFGKEHVFAYV